MTEGIMMNKCNQPEQCARVGQQGYDPDRNFASIERGTVIGAVPAQAAYTSESNAMDILQKAKDHRSLAADQVLMLKMVIPALGAQLTILCEGITQWMRHQGFWIPYSEKYSSREARMEKSEKIALIHSEVSELLEGVRKDDYANEAEECADIAIRLFDYCGNYGIPLAHAIEAKMIKNYGRPYKHDKQF